MWDGKERPGVLEFYRAHNATTFILVIFAHHSLSIWISQESIYRLLSGDDLHVPPWKKKFPTLFISIPLYLYASPGRFALQLTILILSA